MWLLPSSVFGLPALILFFEMRIYERLEGVERQTDTSNAADVPTSSRVGFESRSA